MSTPTTADLAAHLADLHDQVEELARLVDTTRETLAEARIAERDHRGAHRTGS